jgi:myo-inositol-1(or 4)-monophosphatase
MGQTPTLQEIIELARTAGHIVLEGFNHRHTVSFKSEVDVVTEMDHRSEEYLLGEIRSRFPEDSILAEESGSINGSHEAVWIVDPLDGTVNYSHRLPIYSVSIAYQVKGVLQMGVVYDPSQDECFAAERGKGAWLNDLPIHVTDTPELIKTLLVTGFPYDRHGTDFDLNMRYFSELTRVSQGVRRLGSAALDVCYVACGRFDGYWELSIHPWDVAAGALIVEEAGGRVTNVQGSADYLKPPYDLIAANPAIHQAIFEALQEIE